MTRGQLEKAIKFLETGLEGDTYALRVTLRSGQVMQGYPRAHDDHLLPLDADGGGPLVIVLADISAIERIIP